MSFNLTLRWKLTGAAGIVGGMIAVGTLVGLWGMSFAVNAQQQLFDETLPSLTSYFRLDESLGEVQAADAELLLSPADQPAQRAALEARQRKAWDGLETELTLAGKVARKGPEVSTWSDLTRAIEGWRAARGARVRDSDTARTSMSTLLHQRTARAEQTHQKFQGEVFTVRAFVLSAGTFGILIVLAIGSFSASRISRSLDAAVVAITRGTQEVESTTSSLSGDSQSLANSFTTQADAITRTASAMTQLTAMTHQNAGHAGRARELIDGAVGQASHANESMHSVVKSMEEIASTSTAIAHITKSINQIAFQTNLLALNASVEAARAGAAGAGFAVVANEVQALAQRTGLAAQEITGLIDGSTARIAEGTALVKKTNEAFQEVVASVQEVAGIMGQISTASAEQAKGIDDVGGAVVQMDRATQQNGSAATDVAKAVSGLEHQTSELAFAVAEIRTLVEGASAVQ